MGQGGLWATGPLRHLPSPHPDRVHAEHGACGHHRTKQSPWKVRGRQCEVLKPVPAPPTRIQPSPPVHCLPPAPPTSVPIAHTHWEPGAAGPPGAEPLGIGSGWRARALWGEDERAVSAPTEHRLLLPPHHAYLWLWGSPEDSGLFSPSGVWGGWWAPGAGTEVAGSLVALQGDHGVTVTDALTSQVP